MIRKSFFPMLAIVGLALTAPALAGYTSGGTFVVKTQFATIVDNGGVVCDGMNGDGVGGGCLHFPTTSERGSFIGVIDNIAVTNVAFQVCIDNNGDGICGGPQSADCPDQIFYSHADGGKFFNPLGPLPTKTLCPQGFQGYVVLLCTGEHQDRTGPHTHALTQGQIFATDQGSGYGNFCGGGGEGTPSGIEQNAVAKAYRVI